MTCYHPIPAFRTPDGVVFSELARHDILGRIDIACGQCQGCRARRARDWQLRCMHEAQTWAENCFVTLTYSDENLPINGSLDHRDFQLFMKRMREANKPNRIRFFMCGEYGPRTSRPHYHALLFGKDFLDRKLIGKSKSGFPFYESQQLTDLWRLGHATVQDMCSETAGYCCSYVFSKVTGDGADEHYGGRKPDYCACSLKPGIGALWFDIHGEDKSRQDFVVLDGRRTSLPKYYDKLADRAGYEWLEEIIFAREQRAKETLADQTDERLAVREKVHAARVNQRRRDSNG